MKDRATEWWDSLDRFSQFWLFWFGVALVGSLVAWVISMLIGVGD